ncbi:hypothetical protein H6P81_002841 [Aristolochia fimbriata]|uniref:Uncharacterized protein n=1 Tax=Aristolochia fimbriata TaxID=158543 RepID=A0AAV7FB53_ARIFI|nr:hypothetical protein H6P81_002841 [Aristolochia fimbriata]
MSRVAHTITEIEEKHNQGLHLQSAVDVAIEKHDDTALMVESSMQRGTVRNGEGGISIKHDDVVLQSSTSATQSLRLPLQTCKPELHSMSHTSQGRKWNRYRKLKSKPERRTIVAPGSM